MAVQVLRTTDVFKLYRKLGSEELHESEKEAPQIVVHRVKALANVEETPKVRPMYKGNDPEQRTYGYLVFWQETSQSTPAFYVENCTGIEGSEDPEFTITDL